MLVVKRFSLPGIDELVELVRVAAVPTTAKTKAEEVAKIYSLANGKIVSIMPDDSPAPADIECPHPYLFDESENAKLRKLFQRLLSTGVAFTVNFHFHEEKRKFRWQLGEPQE